MIVVTDANSRQDRWSSLYCYLSLRFLTISKKKKNSGLNLVFIHLTCFPWSPPAWAGFVGVRKIYWVLICCLEDEYGRGSERTGPSCCSGLQLVCVCVCVYPRWMVRMCLWMPAVVLRTLPQFFHRHLNITFMEFCRKQIRVELVTEQRVKKQSESSWLEGLSVSNNQ